MNDFPRANRRAGALAAALLCAAALAGGARAADVPQYNRDVRPVLAEACFACHGPDKSARKARLRLDVREEAVKKGAIVPGKPGESTLVERIFSDEPGKLMPPAKSHKKLLPEQKELLKRWVAAGAEYQPHWAFIAPKRPALPAVRKAGWVRNPIDRFVLAGMEKHGLSPAPEADRRTLARRLSLDLVGLPPSPAEVEAFVRDARPDAYERYVDHLMRSVHWGEHRGRYWLDAARYADTHGIHFDNFREMYSYRDWVIRAFNGNMPFDRFTVEQLAGDLLPGATLDQKVASGFNRCNITSNEGGLIPEEYLVLYTRDRTETVSQVWLGLTAGCAVCHSHKFDPLSQKEFYQMAAFFNNSTQGAMDGNIPNTPPTIMVPRMEDRPRWAALQRELTAGRQKVEARKATARAGFEKWLPTAGAAPLAARVPATGLVLHAPLSEGAGDKVAVVVAGKPRTVGLPAGAAWGPGHVADKAYKTRPSGTLELADAGDLEKDRAFSYGAWVRLPPRPMNGAVMSRMDEKSAFRGWDLWVENGQFGTHIVSAWPGNAIKVVGGPRVRPNEWNHVFISYDGSGKAAGVRLYVNGALQTNRNVSSDSLKGSIRTKVSFKLGRRTDGSPVHNALLQDVRVYDRALGDIEVGLLHRGTRAAYLARKPAAKRSGAEKDELFGWYLASEDKGYQEATAALDRLRQEESAVRGRGTVAHVMQERPGAPTAFVLFRGDYDKRREQVTAGTPAVLPPLQPGLPRNRLGFAKWLLRDDHPLTARVTVNRFWQELFGTGIVRTSGDFGATGEPPTHPELLDWLAVEFREEGWDVKRFFKLLVTSAAYRQSAAVTAEKREKDPHNTWLSRGPRFRMDAEMVRDYALAASGLLVRKIGGPSVRPYQPEGVWEAVAMIGSNTRDYRRDRGENLYRRSLYTFWKRAAPPASLEILNAPNRETCAVQRERTNTPLQALVTLNDPQFVEAARFLAEQAMKAGGARPAEGVDFLAKRLLARPFRPAEQHVVERMLGELLVKYRGKPAEAKKLISVGESKPAPGLDPEKLAAWTMLANALMNLDEVLNK
jgi:cytochrome c553